MDADFETEWDLNPDYAGGTRREQRKSDLSDRCLTTDYGITQITQIFLDSDLMVLNFTRTPCVLVRKSFKFHAIRVICVICGSSFGSLDSEQEHDGI
jgi:hypothetical protein